MLRRWIDHVRNLQGTQNSVLHSTEDVDEYMQCPMRWGFHRVIQAKANQLSRLHLYKVEMKRFLRGVWSRKHPMSTEDIRDLWGTWMKMSEYWDPGPELDSVISEGAMLIDELKDVIHRQVAAAPVTTAVSLDSSNPSRSKVRVTADAVFERPFQMVYIPMGPVPRRRKDQAASPVYRGLSIASCTAQRKMGIPYKEMSPVLVIDIDNGEVRSISGIEREGSSAHFTRILECMDILGMWPVRSSQCKTCPWGPGCDSDAADISRLKTRNTTTPASTHHVSRRKDHLTKHADQNQDQEGSSDNPDLL